MIDPAITMSRARSRQLTRALEHVTEAAAQLHKVDLRYCTAPLREAIKDARTANSETAGRLEDALRHQLEASK